MTARTAAACFHVAPTGSDRWPGTPDRPFASPARAARAAAEARRRPVTVVLHDGTFFLERPLILTADVSGSVWTAAPGATPLLSGGQRVAGWRVGTHRGERCWQTTVPADWNFTQLFVNGRRRLRPRLPKTGVFQFADRRPDDFPGGLVRYGNGPTHAYYRPGDLRAFHNLTDTKLVMYNAWYETHHRLKSVDERTCRVDFQSRGFSEGYTGASSRYIVDNVFEALDTPGQWYLDRPTGTLTYLPLADEQLENTEVIAPRLDVLVRVAGTARRPVTNVRLERLAFAHAEWDYAPDFAGSLQAADLVPAAIQLTHAEHCTFFDCRISQIAQYAIEIGTGSHQNAIVGCVLSDLGAGGVKVAHEALPAVAGVYPAIAGKTLPPRATTIADCVIRNGGILFPSAVGVFIGNAGENRVVHNLICDLSYTGISCGWIWGYAPSRTRNNRIEFNHVHHIATDDLLHDLGGIYTLGIHPGSTIRHNYVHHIGGNGIYLDEGSSEMLIEGNLVHHAGLGFTHHYGRDNLVQNNVFAFSTGTHFMPSASERHRSLVHRRNVIYWNQGEFVKNTFGGSDNWNMLHGRFEKNVLWDARNGRHELDFGRGTSLADWQHKGQHLGTLIADPRFGDPANADFSIRPGSPLRRLGIRPLDPARTGPRLKNGRPSYADWLQWGVSPPTPWVRARWEQPGDGLARLILENLGNKTATGRYDVRASDGIRLGVKRVAFKALRPGAKKTFNVPFTAAPGVPRWGLLETFPAGDAIMPAAIRLEAAGEDWVLRRIGALASAEAVAPALRDEQPRAIQSWRGDHTADVQLAIAGDALAVAIEVTDHQPSRGELAWQGSVVEVFATPDASGQWSPTQPNPNVRQAYLLPSVDGHAASGRKQDGHRELLAPEILVTGTTGRGTWRLAALVPLTTLGLAPDQKTFMLQVVVTATPVAGHGAQRGALFYGGISAAGSNLLYGLMRVRQ